LINLSKVKPLAGVPSSMNYGDSISGASIFVEPIPHFVSKVIFGVVTDLPPFAV